MDDNDSRIAEVGDFSVQDPDTSPAGAFGDYREWRKRCPVVHSDALGGYFLLNRYNDVRQGARDWNRLSSAQGVFRPPVPRVRVIEADPPEHTRDRELLKEVVNVDTYRSVEKDIHRICEELIDAFYGRGEVDLVGELCAILPVSTICLVIGLDDDEAERVRPVTMLQFEAVTEPALFPEAESAFNRLVADILSRRRREPREDFVSRLALEPVGGEMQTDAEIANLLQGFLIAGHHTTTSAMASLFRHVLRDTTIRDRLIEDPRLIRSAVEETLRLDPPLHMFGRTATCPVKVEETEIPEGSFVMLNWASANRDQTQFEDPDEFRLDRSPNPHMSFGHGIHTCVGAQLARMEIEIAATTLLERIPDIASDGPLPDHEFLGNLASLPYLHARFAPATPDS